MSIDLKRGVGLVCLGVLALTPIFSFAEVIALFRGTLAGHSEALTPTFIKALRDVAAVLVVVLATLRMASSRKISTHSIFFLLFLILTVVGAVYSLQKSTILALSGIRWASFFFLSFFFIGMVDEELLKKASRVLFFLFLLHFIIQILQLFFMSRWFGVNSLGLSARSPGFFLIPNTGAQFSTFCLFFAWFYPWSKYATRIVTVLAPLSVLLTASGTAVVVCLGLYILMCVPKRYLSASLPLLFIGVVLAFPFLMLITGRESGYVETSLGTRVDIFKDLFESATVWPESFGFGTNTGVLFAETLGLYSGATIADSTYTSILANYGYSGFSLFCLYLLLWGISTIALNDREIIIFTLMCLAFSATSILSETFPINLLGALLVGRYLSTKILLRISVPKESPSSA